jgi:hypothetical protein
MTPNFFKDERAERIVILVIDRPKLLPFSDAVTEVLELALPFAETGLHQDATSSMQFATIEVEITQAGKKGHCFRGCNWETMRASSPVNVRNSWVYFGLD